MQFTTRQKQKLRELAGACRSLVSELLERKGPPIGKGATYAATRSEAGIPVPCCAFGHALARTGFHPRFIYGENSAALTEYLGMDAYRVPPDLDFALDELSFCNDGGEDSSEARAAAVVVPLGKLAAVLEQLGGRAELRS